MLARSLLVLTVVFAAGACSPGGGEPAAQDAATVEPTATVADGTGSPTGSTNTTPEDRGTAAAGTDTGSATGSAADEATVDVTVGSLSALAAADPARRQDAVDAAAAGSPAHAYARFQVAQARAIREQDLEQSDAEVRRSADAITLCYGDRCATYSDFVVEGEPARLVTFEIQGHPVGDRVVAGDEVDPVTSRPVTVELVGALHAAAEESTAIAFEVRNGGDIILDVALYLSEYVGPDGEPHPVLDAVGPAQREPNAIATAVVIFERTGFGGTLTVETTDDEDRYVATLRIPTP